MSAITSTKPLMADQDVRMKWVKGDIKTIPTLRRSSIASLFDAGTVCLFALGSVALIAGLATGIWPVALAGLGPLLLGLLEVRVRK